MPQFITLHLTIYSNFMLYLFFNDFSILVVVSSQKTPFIRSLLNFSIKEKKIL